MALRPQKRKSNNRNKKSNRKTSNSNRGRSSGRGRSSFGRGRDNGDDYNDDGYDDDRGSRGRGRGRGRSGGRGQQRDGEFVYITSLYESKKGTSFTAFVKGEALDILSELKEDDVLCVTEAKKGGMLNLHAIIK